jgi:hypothetical protein
MNKKEAAELIEAVLRRSVERGIVRTGFEKFRAGAIPKDAPEDHLIIAHLAFMAGAEHLFVTMLTRLLSEDQETFSRHMDEIRDEFINWRALFTEMLDETKTSGRSHPDRGHRVRRP